MVNPKSDGVSQEKLRTSANGDHDKESPTADWARAVAMIAAKNKPALWRSVAASHPRNTIK